MLAWVITRKDLLLLVRDRRALVSLLAMPLIFIAILGASTGQLFQLQDQGRQLSVGVVDLSGDPLVRKIVADLARRRGLTVSEFSSEAAARSEIDRGNLSAIFITGPGFRERIDALGAADILAIDDGLLSGGLTSLDMRVEQSKILTASGALLGEMVFGSVLQTIAPVVARKNRFVAQMLDRIDRNRPDNNQPPGPAEDAEADANSKSKKDNGGKEPLFIDKLRKSPNVIYQIVVPSYTVMFSFFLVNLMARSILAERELGTLRRLRMSPIDPASILMGKTIPFFLLSIAQSSVLFLAGRLIFGMTWGTNPWLLIPIIISTSASATTLGLLAATIVRTDSQVTAYTTFIVLTMAGVSGCFMPRPWLPPVMRMLSLVTPHAWSLVAYDQVLTRDLPDYLVVAQCCLVLLGYSAIYFTIGWQRFKTLD